jgi:pimeloyl-ACP methyl ester carboxylesterase
MRHLVKTPPFRGPNGGAVPGSVTEIGYLRLGGLDQWVMIRGESVANPPLILLHGGPGWSEMAFWRYFNAPLEKSFTTVYWDQRGAGKSFDRNVPRSSMTVEQFISDLDDLVEVVCERLGKANVVIYGHSWGSALGVLYAARYPEKARRTSAAGRSATGRRPRRPRTSSGSLKRSASATAGRSGSYSRSGRRPTRPMRCSPSAPGFLASKAACAPAACGRLHERFSAGGSPRSSSCPAQCAASGSP